MSPFRSLLVWVLTISLILVWLPLLAAIRLFDRDPIVYRTGRWFRRLGVAMTKVNPSWKIRLAGFHVGNPRNPYVVVANHQSLADIPILSNLPWEMKWVGKNELFRIPIVGWMMSMAKDIRVDRASAGSGARAILQARETLRQSCSVMFFPEGTRSEDGRVRPFTNGAFHLAITAGVPVLPIAVTGSHGCLPKRSWRFGPPADIIVTVLPPVSTEGYSAERVHELRDTVRAMIIDQVGELQGVPGEAGRG